MSNRRWRKVLSLALVLVLIFQMMPVSAFADDDVIIIGAEDTALSSANDELLAETQEAGVTSEITELRGEAEKHFKLEDGTQLAVMYSDPVHYLEDGQWKDIDNALTLAEAEYSYAANAGTVLSETIAENGELRIVASGQEDAVSSVTVEDAETVIEAEDETDDAMIVIGSADETVEDSVIVIGDEEQSAEDAEIVIEAEEETVEDAVIVIEAEEEAAEEQQTEEPSEIIIAGDGEEEPDSESTTGAEQSAVGSIGDETAAVSQPENAVVTVNESVYTNTANSFRASFPKQFGPGSRVIVSQNGYTLSFGIETAVQSEMRRTGGSAAVLEGTPLSENVYEAAVSSVQSALNYQGVFPGVDLSYELYSSTVKENIILKNLASTPETLYYIINAGGLTAVLGEDGSVEFKDGEETVFTMAAPIMYDVNGEMSDAFSVSLQTLSSGEYRLVYTPDRDWLEDSQRQWPVVIDPAVSGHGGSGYILDAHVCSGKPYKNYGGNWAMKVGYQDSYAICRAFIRWSTLPAISNSDVVLSANLYLQGQNLESGPVEVSAYPITGSWAPATVTWAAQPSYDAAEKLDFQIVHDSTRQIYQWDITRLARRWYSEGISGLQPLTNLGVALISNKESAGGTNYCELYAVEGKYTVKPALTVQYISASGTEDYWDSTSQSIGRAGTVSVNNYSGSLTLTRTDLGYSGNRMPVQIAFTYNYDYAGTNIGYGRGWRMNYSHQIESKTIDNVQYYKWMDGDGTVKYFVNSGGTWIDEAGQGYTLTVGGSSTSGVKYTITDKELNRLEFDDTGRLVYIVDGKNSANKISIVYAISGSTHMAVSYILDGAGRKYAFSYNSVVSGVMTSCSYYGTGSTALETVNYTYSANRPTVITYADGKTAQYVWSNDMMATAKDITKGDGTNDYVNIEYYVSSTDSSLPVRAKKLSYYSQGGLVSSASFYYGPSYTKVTDNVGRWCTYQFNDWGNTTSVYNQDGQALFGRYAKDNSSSGRANQLVSASRLQDTVTGEEDASRVNMLSNADLTTDSSGWTSWSSSGTDSSDGRCSESGSRANLDSYALRIYGSGTAQKSMSQSVSVTDGAAHDNYSFGCWVKAASVPLDNKCSPDYSTVRRCGILVRLYNGSTMVGEKYVPVNDNCGEWQFISGGITASAAYNSVNFYCIYDYNANAAYFDGMQLFRENFASLYEYDSAGNITKVTDISGNVTRYSYLSGTSEVSSISLPGGGTYSYSYGGNRRLTQTVSATGVTTQYSYDSYGNSTRTKILSSTDSHVIQSDSSYTADGNMLASVTTGDRSTVTYTNDTQRSQVTQSTDARGNVTAYSYDSMGRPTVTSTGSSSVTNTYQNDLLSTITHTNTSGKNTVYTLSYGPADLLTGVKVGSRNLVTNQYTSGRWTLARQTYGNGDYWKYSYNNSDQLTLRFTNLTDSSGISYAYLYNSKGQLKQVNRSAVTIANEAITGSTLLGSESYSYDSSDRPVRTTTTDSSGNVTQDISWTYNSSEKVSSMTESIGSFSATYNYAYDNDKRPVSVSFGGIIGAIAYDGFSRMISQTVTSGGNNVLTTDYTYRNIDGTYTSTQVASLSNSYGDEEDGYSYTYDANGNITGISGSQTAQYAYDALNQLVWEKNTSAGKAWQYSYDNGGNILSRTAYDYDGSNTSNPETVNYSYTDSTWGDLLTAYDGQEITYDGNGNPLSYRGWTMSWQGGRQLASMTGSSKSLSFAYGESGLRLGKTCTVDDSSTVHTYTWNGSLLSSDICGNTALYFHYDANGSPMGFTLVNSEGSTGYFYVKNLQGDILKVIDAAGTVHASYTYDAWGNILSTTGNLANVNPLRYRGYYYDSESGFYYVSSRYYDSEIGRFVNADDVDLLGANGDFASLNLFAYCGDNPVARIDRGGEFWETAFDVISLGASIVEVCVNPVDPWAWAGLVGDAIDLIPFVTGVGEATRAVKATIKVVDKTTDVVDAAKTLCKTADAASDIRKATGSYEILYKSGWNYIGKGGFYRAINSATRNATKYGDEVTSIMWKSAPNSRAAFIDEYLMQKRFGGVLSSDPNLHTYNIIWSPGRRYYGD